MKSSSDVVVNFLTITTIAEVGVEKRSGLRHKRVLPTGKLLARQLDEDNGGEQRVQRVIRLNLARVQVFIYRKQLVERYNRMGLQNIT